MARFLFVVPPLTGHVNPTVAVGQVLTERGHDVAWVGHPTRVGPLITGELIALDESADPAVVTAAVTRAGQARGLASLKSLWEDFVIPLCHDMVPGVERAVERWRPDVIITDQQAVAGALVARRRGIPWATSCTTSASVGDALAAFPRVRAWQQAQLERLGVPDDVSPHLVLVFSSRDLVQGEFPAHYAFVGPAIRGRPEVPFPWEALREGPRLLISLGTVNADRGARFYRECAEALGGEPLQVVLAAPAIGGLPDNFIRRDYVPQLALLKHVDAVVCHGGHNTVCEALAHGLPLVVAPIKHDQPVVAHQVVTAGAGVRVKFGRVKAPALREAVRAVLSEPPYREAAARIAKGFERAGGAAEAARRLEQLP